MDVDMKRREILALCILALLVIVTSSEDESLLRCANRDQASMSLAEEAFAANASWLDTAYCENPNVKNPECVFMLVISGEPAQQTIELNTTVHWSYHFTHVLFSCFSGGGNYGECFPDCLIMLPPTVTLRSQAVNGRPISIDYRGCCCSKSECNQPSRIVVLHENEPRSQATLVNYAALYNRSVESLTSALKNWTAPHSNGDLFVPTTSKPPQQNDLPPLFLIAIVFIACCAVAVALLLTYFVKKMRDYRRLAEAFATSNGTSAQFANGDVHINGPFREDGHANGIRINSSSATYNKRYDSSGMPTSLSCTYPFSNSFFREVLAVKQAEHAFPFVDVTDLQLVRAIARGRFGAVWIGKSPSAALNGGDPDAQFAVKVLPSTNRQSWQTELEVYTLLGQNENILRFLGAGVRGEGPMTELFLLTEYHLIGSLYDFLKRDAMSWRRLLRIAHGMASGLAYLHEEVVPRSTSCTQQLAFVAPPCVPASGGWRAAQSGSAGVSSGTAATIQSNVTGQTALSLTSQPRPDSVRTHETVLSPSSIDFQAPLANGETRRAKPSIAHRDFKSKNVLLDSALNARIGDFGLALVFAPGEGVSESQPQVGTRLYMAPEVIEGAIQFTRDAFLRIDVYALSLVLWECASRCWQLNAPSPIDANVDAETADGDGEGEVISNVHTTPNPIHTEFCGPYRLPFEAALGASPPLEDLKDWVVHKRLRPELKPDWRSKNEWTKQFCVTVQECWDADAEARLSAKCVEERMASLLRACNDAVRSPGSPPPPTTGRIDLGNNQLQLEQSPLLAIDSTPTRASQPQAQLQPQPQPQPPLQLQLQSQSQAQAQLHQQLPVPPRLRGDAYDQPSNDAENIALLHD